jgi:hypothetical protein
MEQFRATGECRLLAVTRHPDIVQCVFNTYSIHFSNAIQTPYNHPTNGHTKGAM